MREVMGCWVLSCASSAALSPSPASPRRAPALARPCLHLSPAEGAISNTAFLGCPVSMSTIASWIAVGGSHRTRHALGRVQFNEAERPGRRLSIGHANGLFHPPSDGVDAQLLAVCSAYTLAEKRQMSSPSSRALLGDAGGLGDQTRN